MYERIFTTAKAQKKRQTELAAHLGITPGVLSDWKSGRLRPSSEAISKLAAYMNVTADYLLGLSDDPYPHGEEPVAEVAILRRNAMQMKPADRAKMMRILAASFDHFEWEG